MKRTIKNLLILTIIVAMISLTGIVNAASVTMGLSANENLKAGEIVTVVLRISNISAGEGIDTIVGTLEYDNTVFEEVTQDTLVGRNSWNVMIYNSANKMFTATRSSKVNMASDVIYLTLRAKQNVAVNSSIVKIKDISVSGGAVDMGGTGDIKVTDVQTTISKESASLTPSGNTQVNQQPLNVAGLTNNNVNTQGSNGKLPQTGEGIELTIGIAIVAIISVIAYIRYRNVKF